MQVRAWQDQAELSKLRVAQTKDLSLDLKANIQSAYIKSGNDLGWRLLASPASVMSGAKIAFIGLNPAGKERPIDHPEFCMSEGSAYATEVWHPRHKAGESRLQIQVLTLFNKLDVEPSAVLAGNLVPFRSQSWNQLKDRAQSLQFGEALWRDILHNAKPELVIGMGKETVSALSRILNANEAQFAPVGWGNISGSRARFKNGLLVGIPHLSRFGIMTRPQSASPLRNLFGNYWKD